MNIVPHVFIMYCVIGLDFKNLHQMTELLSEAGFPTDVAFTIREHFNFTPGAKSLAEVYILYICTYMHT